MRDFTTRRARFRELHKSGCFVISNPWDVGTAIFLERAGFQALATTSAGFAFSKGLPDTPDALSLDSVLTHIAEIVSAVDLPVHADFQSGYARDAAGVAESVRLCIETGVAGLSIEDASGDPARPLFDLPEAVDRLAAARHAIIESGMDVSLTGRAECYVVGHPDPLNESIARIRAYAAAGADVIFVPGVREPEAMRAIVEAVAPTPVNVVVTSNIGLRVPDLAALGVRRISVGSALSRAAWGGMMRAARGLLDGAFDGLEGAAAPSELNALFALQQPDNWGR